MSLGYELAFEVFLLSSFRKRAAWSWVRCLVPAPLLLCLCKEKPAGPNLRSLKLKKAQVQMLGCPVLDGVEEMHILSVLLGLCL